MLQRHCCEDKHTLLQRTGEIGSAVRRCFEVGGWHGSRTFAQSLRHITFLWAMTEALTLTLTLSVVFRPLAPQVLTQLLKALL